MKQIRHILFIELLGGIGDLVMALPAIHALGRSHRAAHVTVLTFTPGSELLQHDPLIHQVVHAENGAARRSVEQLLACKSFDLIVSDTNYDGIAELIDKSGAQQVVTTLWRSPPPDEFVSDRFLDILLAEGLITGDVIADSEPQIYLTATERAIARQSLGSAYRPLVFLCPDAGMSIKRWSVANVVALGKALQQQYNATIIVPIGSNCEQANQIAKAIGGTANVWQRGSLRQLAGVLAEADLVVAADTGPARIAAALNTPTITLFGPSWHGRYGQSAPHINLQGFPDCPERIVKNFTEQPCWYSNQCPFEWKTCLEDISPETVLQAAAPFLMQVSEQGRRTERDTATQKHGNTEARRLFNLQSTICTLKSPPRTPHSALRTPHPPWHSIHNLLILRLDNIGDVIMTSPALRALRENLPEARITLMASPGGALTAPLLPWVDDVLSWRVLWQDLGRLDFNPAREWELIERLKNYQFDAAIIFTSFTQSPHPAALICALAGISLRLGESKESDLGTLTHAVPVAPDELHQVERNLRLIESVGFQVRDRRLTLHIPNYTQQTTHQLLRKLVNSNHLAGGAKPDKASTSHLSPLTSHLPPYILLNPWTSCQSRNYNPERFAIAARQLSEITGWSVVVTGVEKDRDRSHALLKTLGDCAIDLIGQTTLTELVAIVAGAKLVLTNNTSTMHIADAMNTSNVVLFAGTEQECQWQPRHSPSRLLRRLTVCSPCYAFTCSYDLQCLDIPPEAVVLAGLELLGIKSEHYKWIASGKTHPLTKDLNYL